MEEKWQLVKSFNINIEQSIVYLQSKVINVGSDTLGNPIFHEGLQN